MIGGSNPIRGWEFFSSPPRPHRLCDPPNLRSSGYSFPEAKASGAWSWPLRLVPRLTRGAIPPFPQYVALRIRELPISKLGPQTDYPDWWFSWFSLVTPDSGIALGYGLDDGGSSPDRGWEFFSLPQRPYRLWGPTQPTGAFPGSKAAGAWSWPLASVKCLC
jgi:hypothetical protein